MQNIGIIGAGAWGTALAQTLAGQSLAGGERRVVMWAREPEVVAAINDRHENTVYLPGIPLDPAITATESLSALKDCGILLLVTPAQHVRASLSALQSEVAAAKPIVICAKGIELETGNLMTQVAAEAAPKASIAILTGPTFAAEIARGLPSAVTIAAKDKDVAQEIREQLASKTLRPYITDDMIGAQIGGAVKNVIAIACGIIYGKEMGESAKAALMTRGLAEMARLTSAMGGKKETLMGMCGFGDMVLTCSSMQSRNFSLGVALAKGQALADIMSNRKSVAEGVHTARALMTMAKKHAVDMPISEAVFRCVNGDATVSQAIEELLDRPLRPEAL
jgi:glycerol-3-phosphate dehydrogenase (NAD(P)+)